VVDLDLLLVRAVLDLIKGPGTITIRLLGAICARLVVLASGLGICLGFIHG
jgi:hypothetical protein